MIKKEDLKKKLEELKNDKKALGKLLEKLQKDVLTEMFKAQKNALDLPRYKTNFSTGELVDEDYESFHKRKIKIITDKEDEIKELLSFFKSYVKEDN